MSVRLASACALLFTCCLTVATPAMADDPVVPAACKLKGAKRVAIGNFTFSPVQLEEFRQRHQFVQSCPAAAKGSSPSAAAQKAKLSDLIDTGSRFPPAICGIVDEWHYAAVMAYQHCNSLAASSDQAYFSVAQPSAFNDAQNHHAQYRFSDPGNLQALSGSCYVCPHPSAKPMNDAARSLKEATLKRQP